MLPLPPSCFDKFLPLLPSARRGLERRRRKTKEEELTQDIDEMMDIILPLCLSRPNVYFHLSEILSKWIITLEQNDDDEKDLETTLSSSIQSYKDDDDDDDDLSVNSVLSSDNSKRYSINFHSPQLDEETDLYSKSLKSLKLIRQEQSMKQLPSTTPTNTVKEVRLDTQFLQHKVYTIAKDECTRRISDVIYNLIQKFESDIENYNSIQHNEDRRFQKEWNNEQDLLLRLLDYLEACINLVNHQYCETNNNITYPYAHVYNALLNHYLAHTRTSSSEDEQSHHYRWKRPERPSSETRRKDVEMIEEMISMITSQEKENFDVASVRVIEILKSMREYCITEVQQLIQIENRALKRFNHALSYEEKDRLFSSQVLVDIDF